MMKRAVYLLFFVFVFGGLSAQQKTKIQLVKNKKANENTEQLSLKPNGFILRESISAFDMINKETKDGTYHRIELNGLSKTFDAGKPDLPVMNRLIEVPLNADAKIKVLNYEEEIVDLKNYGIERQIIPAQPSLSKSDDPEKVKFHKDKEIYSRNQFFKKEMVRIEDRGYLRDKHLAYIEISPFSYNPVSNTLKVITNIEIEVNYVQKNSPKLTNVSKLQSPYFKDIVYNTINKSEESKELINAPVKYVIVSDRMFEETLQPFIEWKTMKGYHVIEAYTDIIGTSKADIKNYLQDLYDNPSDGVSPTFVLLVGDVDQIPAYSSSGHYTDLYYFEYTGDKLPEVFYGRFSAESIEELQPQIDKTLEVEKYEMPDPSYLDNVVLVAGVDGGMAPTHGNGAINYSNAYYTNTDNGITSYYYLYGDDSGVMSSNSSGASASIRSYISEGVSFSNYTAHCGSSGWSDPSFTKSHIEGLTNEHMYPLIIGNCCQSNTFYDDDCFGEEILMAANKGAVGYIGGSDLTYWDEDYYWGVGLASSITANPTYEGTGLGAYDRFFHLNGEAKEDWYITQGQINVAGNLAVEASGSGLKTYYWEIYHLMGDPSLTPYVTVPETLFANYESEVIIGVNAFEVITEENAYVAISKDGVLLDARLANESGMVNLSFEPLSEVGELDLVITKQNRQPLIDKIYIKPASTPYVIVDYHLIDDDLGNSNLEADYGETIKLDVQFKNVSDSYDALNLIANLTSNDTNLVITDNTENLGTILKSDSAKVEGAYTIQLKNKFNDQHEIPFEVVVAGKDSENNDYTWDSKFSIIVNAPELEIEDLFIDDSEENDNGILDPGETADISLIVANNGHSAIADLNGIATILADGGTYLTLNNTETGSFSVDAFKTDTIHFNATANSETPIGTMTYLTFDVNDVLYNYYTVSSNKELNIGEIPEILISDNDTTIADKAYFYDTGGSLGNYSNYEKDTITLSPLDEGKFLKLEFLSFNVEPYGSSCYDYLKIFDGENTEADLIGTYCDSNKPDIIEATNEMGALTFTFYSDGSEIRSGWEAEVKSFAGYDYTLTITGPNGPVEGASVELLGRTETTGVDGIVSFYNIPEGINYILSITATGYEDFESSINIFDNTTEEITLEEAKFDITFNLMDEDGSVDGDVTFNGETLSTENGSVTFKDVIYSTNETYLIQAFAHADSTASIEVTSDLSLIITLKSYKFDVEFIISDGVDPIQGAIVEFDNKDIYTNMSGVAIFNQVKMDTALYYTVRKTGYNNLTDKINVLDNLSLNLIMGSGIASFKVVFEVQGESAPLYNAQVVLDEDTLYTNTEGIATFTNVVEATGIPYKISKVHFDDASGTIDVAGDNIFKEVNLKYTTYEIVFNIDDGNNPVEEAVVSFDGKSGSTDANGQCIFDVVYSLNKKYTISKFGYDILNGKVNADADKLIFESLSLSAYNVTFYLIGPDSYAIENATVEFNGESKYTDPTGKAIFEDVACDYNKEFTLSKTGFNNYDSTLNVIDKDVIFNAQLSVFTAVDQLAENAIAVYPNPSNGLFNIEISSAEEKSYQVKVFDVIGSIVYSNSYHGVSLIKEQVNITHKAKGMYFLSIESDDGSIISKRILVK